MLGARFPEHKEKKMIRHKIVRAWKVRLANHENSASLSVGLERDMYLRFAENMREKINRLRNMSDSEFEARFLVGREVLADF